MSRSSAGRRSSLLSSPTGLTTPSAVPHMATRSHDGLARPQLMPLPIYDYRGRVRTGCLTCRTRKVKCDEKRPTCQQCTRLRKTCVYSTASKRVNLDAGQADGQVRRDRLNNAPDASQPGIGRRYFQTHEQLSPTGDLSDPDLSVASEVVGVDQSREDNLAMADAGPPSPNHVTPDRPDGVDSVDTPQSSQSRFEQATQDIYVCTTMDLLAFSDTWTESLYSYFIEEVDCPLLTPFDGLNWRIVKTSIAQLAARDESVAEALVALQTIYRAQENRLPMAHPNSLYEAATATFESLSSSDGTEFETVLLIGFLLCLCMVTLPNNDACIFGGFQSGFVTRMENWLHAGRHSHISLRICAWLRLLHAATRRSGSPGLLPEPLSNLLHSQITTIPNLVVPQCPTHSADYYYNVISAPMFDFFVHTQKISNEVAALSHYNRSRILTTDQEEVLPVLDDLKDQLLSLWEVRPATLRDKPQDTRRYFCQSISEHLISVAGICLAAYQAEIIAIGRTVADPPFASVEAKQAMSQIRDIITGDWNAFDKHRLNPGYARPLFLYAIESMQQEESQWAVDHLRQIKNTISSGQFLAALAEALGKEQRSQQRRVTVKYFCLKHFDAPLPFI